VNMFCSGKSRNDLIDADQKSLYSFFSDQMQTNFKLDGYINSYLETILL
jgi:hypothetical protein